MTAHSKEEEEFLSPHFVAINDDASAATTTIG